MVSEAGGTDQADGPAEPADGPDVTRPQEPPRMPEPGTQPSRPTFVHRPARHGLIGPFTGRQLTAAIIAVAAVGLLLVFVTTPLAGAPTSTGRPQPTSSQFVVGAVTEGLRVGDRAPELAVTRSDGSVFRLTDLDGNPISLAALRGHPVWIDFWASWCPPCQEETPVLRDIYNSYKDRGLVLIAISVQETSAADVRAYAEKYELPYTVAADLGGDIFRLYRIYGLPTQFFIDANGVIQSVVQGPVDYDLAVANLQGIVPGPATSSATPSPSPS